LIQSASHVLLAGLPDFVERFYIYVQAAQGLHFSEMSLFDLSVNTGLPQGVQNVPNFSFLMEFVLVFLSVCWDPVVKPSEVFFTGRFGFCFLP
jgi:hypothetical protein